MLDHFLKNAEHYIQVNPWMGIVAVFVGGLLTATNPCVLAMIPLMMSFVAGQKERDVEIKVAFLYSVIFVLGLSITFAALGISATFMGSLYGDVSSFWNWIVACVCLVMGLHLMGILNFTISMPIRFQPKTRGLLGALILGLMFGLVSIPCAAPILVVLLTYLAGANTSVAYGGFLLLIYAFGHSVLIILAGTSMGFVKKIVESKKTIHAIEKLRKMAGFVIVLVGFYFCYLGLK